MNMIKFKNILHFSAFSLACVFLTACQLDVNVADSDTPPESDDSIITPPGASNTPPVILGQPNSVAISGVEYSFLPQGSDTDGDDFSYSVGNQPNWLFFNENTGELKGTPTASDIGTIYSDITLTVSDGVDSSKISFTVTVVIASGPETDPINNAPTISGMPQLDVIVGNNYIFSPSANDSDGTALSFSISNLPSWASFNVSTGRLAGVPTVNDEGSYSNISISVSDGKASVALASFDVVVLARSSSNSNAAPIVSGMPPGLKAYEGNMYLFTPSVSDADGDTLSYSIVNRPGWLSFNTATGELSGTPSIDNIGVYPRIVISVTDGVNSVSLQSVDIVVKSKDVTLSWEAPVDRTDGVAIELFEISGYRIYMGDSTDNLNFVVEVTGAQQVDHTINNLQPGVHYFSVSTFDSSGLESSYSNIVSFDM